jgi:hypothetical protein
MSEVVSQAPSVVAIIGELVPAGMSQHMRMHREWQPSCLPSPLNHPKEPSCCCWGPSFGHEDIRTPAL